MKNKAKKKCNLYFRKHRKTEINRLIEFIIKYHPGNEKIMEIYNTNKKG